MKYTEFNTLNNSHKKSIQYDIDFFFTILCTIMASNYKKKMINSKKKGCFFNILIRHTIIPKIIYLYTKILCIIINNRNI